MDEAFAEEISRTVISQLSDVWHAKKTETEWDTLFQGVAEGVLTFLAMQIIQKEYPHDWDVEMQGAMADRLKRKMVQLANQEIREHQERKKGDWN